MIFDVTMAQVVIFSITKLTKLDNISIIAYYNYNRRREVIKMTLYIRNFPDQLHKTLKMKAAELGISLSSLVIQILEISFSSEKREEPT